MSRAAVAPPPVPLPEPALGRLQALAAELDPQQLRWAADHLAGLARRDGRPNAGGATAAPARVLYGTDTGNARELAETLVRTAAARGLELVLQSMADYNPRQLARERCLVVMTATHGDGEPPPQAAEFHEFLLGPRAPRLDGCAFAVLGLGDSSYDHFCRTGRDFDARLEALGAERLLERLDCDVDFEEAAEQWSARLLPILEQRRGAAAAPVVGLPAAPSSTAGYDRRHPVQARVLDNICLSGRHSSKLVHHLELSLTGTGLRYRPGDALGVWPENDPEVVTAILKAVGATGDEPVQERQQTLSLRDCLTRRREITALTPRVVQAWAELCGAEELAERVESGEDSIRSYCREAQVLELLQAYPAPGIEPQALVGVLRPLIPRLYSIASSQAAVDEEVHLTVSLVRYGLHGRTVRGVGSGFLAGLKVGAEVPVYVHRNDAFRLPAAGAAPLILIGAGTGIAPYRAFLQDLEASGAGNPVWLFFGERTAREDFLYQTEWQRWLKRGTLSRMTVAFSRDQAEKRYVQHRLLEHGRDLAAWISDGAWIYVCGDAQGMAPAVEQSLARVLQTQLNRSADEAHEQLAAMRRERRYQVDVY